MKSTLFFCFIFLILSASCGKDKVIPVNPNEPDCYDFPPSQSPFGYQYLWKPVTILAACYNPNNADEIAYVKQFSQVPIITELRVRNFVTGQDHLLANDVWGNIDWSSKNWILFNHADNRAWKIKSNGDSLTDLTPNSFSDDAVWNYTGDKFISYKDSTGILSIIRDQFGNEIDTLSSFSYGRGAWGANNRIYSVYGYMSTYGIAYYDLSSNNISQIITIGFENAKYGIGGMDYSPAGNLLVWANGLGIHLTNLSSNSTTLIRAGCDSRTYNFPRFSPDGNKIITVRLDSRIDGDNIITDGYIVVMDKNGENEKMIDL